MSSMKLVQFMYSSILNDKNEALLNDILLVSKRNNVRNAITGMIYYDDGRLVQVLEGPSLIVENTFSRIACDQRHNNLNYIGCKVIERREFLMWDMGFLKIPGADIEQSFSRYALFRFGSNLLDERAAHGISANEKADLMEINSLAVFAPKDVKALSHSASSTRMERA